MNDSVIVAVPETEKKGIFASIKSVFTNSIFGESEADKSQNKIDDLRTETKKLSKELENLDKGLEKKHGVLISKIDVLKMNDEDIKARLEELRESNNDLKAQINELGENDEEIISKLKEMANTFAHLRLNTLDFLECPKAWRATGSFIIAPQSIYTKIRI